jgi:hypothetical protein
MRQNEVLREMRRRHWRALQQMLRVAYQQGLDQGRRRAHGQGRRGRTIRADATVEGLIRRIERHFGLGRFGFEVRIVHGRSGRRVPEAARLRRFLVEP